MKLLVCDLDGVIADNTARFAKAEEAKRAYRRSPASITDVEGEKKAIDIYWREAFNPELVALDTLIEGVIEALVNLRDKQGYKLMYLTSRPEHMREATETWLYERDVLDGQTIVVMKPSAFQFVKTTTWKAGTIQMLASLYGAGDLLVVDDEQINRDVLLSADSDDFPHMRVVASLAEAIA